MYEKQRKASVAGQGASQRSADLAAPKSSDLRGMSYAEGSAHLAPPVQLSAAAAAGGGDQEKLLRIVTAYVDGTFGGDMERAFNHYANEGAVTQDGVTKMLVDAGVKDAFSYFKWKFIPGKVMDHFDTDGDGKIGVAEFNKGLAV